MIGSVIGVVSGLAAAGAACMLGPPILRRRSEVADLRRRAAGQRALVLTYDDGPGPVLTGRLLDLLAARGAVATFFLLGFRAAAAPGAVERVVAAGHEVGCHTQRHLNAWKTPPWVAGRDIDGGYRSMARWMKPDALFRPPYGKTTLMTRRALRRRGAPVAWWTVDSGDSYDVLPDPGTVVDRVRANGGGVVLMHDYDAEGGSADRHADFVLRTTSLLLDAAEKDGLRVCRMSELLTESRP